MEKLTKAELYILEQIENDKKFFTDHSIEELAKRYFVSNTTILRLVKKMAFNKLKDMQIFYNQKLLIENLTKVNDDYLNDFSNKNDIIEITSALSLYPIIESVKVVNVQTIDIVADKIKHAAHINMFGIGNSNYSLEYFHNMLKRIGISSSLNSSVGGFLTELNFLTQNSIVIVMSNTLKTKEIKYVLENIPNNIAVVLIKNKEAKFKTKLSNFFEINFVANEKEKYMFPVISSSTSQIFILNILFNMILSKMDNYIEKIKTTNIIVDKYNSE